MSDVSTLRLESISFAYGNLPVLDDVSLELRQGDMLALVGPNGSGKTTLLHVMSGVLWPSKGSVSLDCRPLKEMARRAVARRIGVVAQHLDPSLSFSVEEIVALGRAPYFGPLGTLSRVDRDAVQDALGATGVEDLARKRFSELSGGEQQRVMLATALAQETDYLLLDEPTVHLDLKHQVQLLELLRTLQKRRALAVVAVLHDINAAALYFERIAVLRAGMLVQQGSSREVLGSQGGVDAFETPLHVIDHPSAHVPQVLLNRQERT
ncbi:MAG TPA: ABC transporter ATP-binding protein [Chloroflexota bacterium]